ncbi:MAG: matrixin family metalloprotease [Natronospirillum sp.]|uniref:matrixin family metalloprotease n=1 Tax=Natronospirillum sp. TaxID=2812955 RepID=UPI0025E8B987|nr:matrixin family metalloprotease [Natronospirillum sp.]MCH8553057.1 matrixin family metalloprotease [Natronospirillum sp.]
MRTFNKTQFFIWALLIAAPLLLALPLSADNGEGGYRLLQLDGYKVKWGDQTLGTGASITYAFAEETMRFDGARNCGELAPMTLISGEGLSYELLQQETAAAFQTWERAADLTFHRIDDARKADIVLGAQGKPIGQAYANVTYRPGSQDGVRAIDQALVCLNPERGWKVGFDGNTNVYDIRYTLIHEIGHAVGLDHPGPTGQIMGFRYTEAFAGLQPGDLRGIRLLYGPSPNDGAVATTEVDTQPLESPTPDEAVRTPASLSID